MVLWDVLEIPREMRLGTPEKKALLEIPGALSDAQFRISQDRRKQLSKRQLLLTLIQKFTCLEKNTSNLQK